MRKRQNLSKLWYSNMCIQYLYRIVRLHMHSNYEHIHACTHKKLTTMQDIIMFYFKLSEMKQKHITGFNN